MWDAPSREPCKVDCTPHSALLGKPPQLQPAPPAGAAGPDTQAPLFFLLSQGLRIAAGMKLVPVALMYLGSLIFLGVDTARLDVAAEFRKK